MIRLGDVRRLAADLAGSRSSAKLRSEDLEHPSVYAAYARMQALAELADSTIQVGRIPPTFGAFSRRAYSDRQSGHRLPARLSVPDVAAHRRRAGDRRRSAADAGAGLAIELPGRSRRRRRPGVPLVSGFRWDTGVQVGWKGGPVEVAGAVTNGTLSNPRVVGRQRRQAGVRAASASRRRSGSSSAPPGRSGAWLARERAGRPTRPTQQALRRRRRILARSLDRPRRDGLEPLGRCRCRSRRRTRKRVDALGRWIEGRYRITPRIFVAGRADRLGFSDASRQRRRCRAAAVGCAGDAASKPAVGYYLQRNLVVRATRPGATGATAGRVATAPTSRRSSRTGSDDHRTTTACLASVDRARRVRVARAARRAAPALAAATGTIRGRVVAAAGRRCSCRRASASTELGMGRPAHPGRPPQRRLPRSGAARRLRHARGAAGADGSAQRDVRAARAGDRRRHDGGFSEQRSHVPQRVLALEDQVVRPRPLRRRAVEDHPVRSARHRPRLLRHPFAHERVHPRVRAPLLRRHRRGRALPDRQRAARHLHRRSTWNESDAARLAARRDAGGRRRSRAQRSRSAVDDAVLVAHQPDLLRLARCWPS